MSVVALSPLEVFQQAKAKTDMLAGRTEISRKWYRSKFREIKVQYPGDHNLELRKQLSASEWDTYQSDLNLEEEAREVQYQAFMALPQDLQQLHGGF